MKPITFGIKTAPQHTTYEAMRRVWQEADEHPAFAHAWLFDHYAPIYSDVNGPCLEGWTTLAALAAETKRIRLGLMVTGNTYRHPAVLASIAATVDIVSNGRVDLGIGAGWNEYEHTSMGIPLYAPGERIRCVRPLHKNSYASGRGRGTIRTNHFSKPGRRRKRFSRLRIKCLESLTPER